MTSCDSVTSEFSNKKSPPRGLRQMGGQGDERSELDSLIIYTL